MDAVLKRISGSLVTGPACLRHFRAIYCRLRIFRRKDRGHVTVDRVTVLARCRRLAVGPDRSMNAEANRTVRIFMKLLAAKIRKRLARAVATGAFKIDAGWKLCLLLISGQVRITGLVLSLRIAKAIRIKRPKKDQEENEETRFKLITHTLLLKSRL
jgi:hypothetical protein